MSNTNTFTLNNIDIENIKKNYNIPSDALLDELWFALDDHHENKFVSIGFSWDNMYQWKDLTISAEEFYKKYYIPSNS